MFENIALSFQGIWNHKTRSFLTMLGIIIGIAAIITIVSTIEGTNNQIKQNLIGAGTNVVNVQLSRTDGGYIDHDYGGQISGVSVIDRETRDSLKELPGVKGASLYVKRDWAENCYYVNSPFEGAIYGVDDAFFTVAGYGLNYGRGFIEKDFTERRKVAVVDSKVLSGLFEGQNPVGETIEIKGEPFTVVGVVTRAQNNALVINSIKDYEMYSDQSSGTIFVPIDSWSTLYKYDEVQNVAVRANSTDEMTEAGNGVAESLTTKLVQNPGTYRFQADNLLEQASELQSLSNSTNQQLIWIAGISLLVGGIGVMNIMLVSVTERTREIGLKKAIGAKRGRILWQFLTEAAVLTSLGGILGVLSGIGLSRVLTNVTGIPAGVSIPACVIAVAFSMLIGIVFGLIPAVKAARLNPIDALRYE